MDSCLRIDLLDDARRRVVAASAPARDREGSGPGLRTDESRVAGSRAARLETQARSSGRPSLRKEEDQNTNRNVAREETHVVVGIEPQAKLDVHHDILRDTDRSHDPSASNRTKTVSKARIRTTLERMPPTTR